MKRHILVAAVSALLYTAQPHADVMIGAYVPGDGFSTEEISNLNSVLEKPLSFINIFSSFSHDWDHLYWQTSNVVSANATPMISWMPIDLSRPNANLLGEIVQGNWDGYVDQWVDRFAAWINSYPAGEQPTIMIRFAHEFNGPWYAYGDSPAMLKAAWTYVHDRFTAAGVSENVEWVWSADTIDVDQYSDITAYYPGDDYVDWTSLDGYNWGSNHQFTSWESFNEIYANQYLELVDNYPSKPVLIGEFASAEESDVPNQYYGQWGDNSDVAESKSQWMGNMLTQLEEHYPAVRAISLFNVNHELGWSLTGDQNTGLESFNSGLTSDYFTSSFVTTLGSSLEESMQEMQDQAHAEKLAAERQLKEAELAEVVDDIGRQQEVVDSVVQDYAAAASLVTAQRELFLNKHDVLVKNRGVFIKNRNEFLNSRVTLNDTRQLYLSGHRRFKETLTTYIESREQFIVTRKQYLAAYQHYQGLGGVEKVDYLPTFRSELNLFRLARDSFIANRDLYISARNGFIVSRSDFIDGRAAYSENRDEYTTSRKVYMELAGNWRTLRATYIETVNSLTRKRNERASALEVLNKLKHKHTELTNNLNDPTEWALNDDNADAFATRKNDASVSGKKNDKTNSGASEDQSGNDKPVKEKKKKLKIDKNTQIALAMSSKPEKVDKAKANKKAEGFRNLDDQEKNKIKSEKLSSLAY